MLNLEVIQEEAVTVGITLRGCSQCPARCAAVARHQRLWFTWNAKGISPWKQGPKGHSRECPQGHCHITCWHCWVAEYTGWEDWTPPLPGMGVKSTLLRSDANFSSPVCFSGKRSSPDPNLMSSFLAGDVCSCWLVRCHTSTSALPGRQTGRHGTVAMHRARWFTYRQALLGAWFKHWQVRPGGATLETGHRGIFLPCFLF